MNFQLMVTIEPTNDKLCGDCPFYTYEFGKSRCSVFKADIGDHRRNECVEAEREYWKSTLEGQEATR